MITWVNKFIPFKGYKSMMIWPILFIRKGCKFDSVDLNHELIHSYQQMEMLFVGVLTAIALFATGCGGWSLLALPVFFYWYGIEYVIRLIQYRNTSKAYRNISFEQEAYLNELDADYLEDRFPFSWVQYLRK